MWIRLVYHGRKCGHQCSDIHHLIALVLCIYECMDITVCMVVFTSMLRYLYYNIWKWLPCTKDSQQHEIKDLSTAEEDVHVSNDGESSPLIGTLNNWRRITLRMLPNLHVRCQRCCLTSNAVIHILVWNINSCCSFLDTDILFRGEPDKFTTTILSRASYSMLVTLFLFYPLAGYLADIRWGRYKTVVYSYMLSGGSLVLAVVLVCLASLSIIPVMIKANTYLKVSCYYWQWSSVLGDLIIPADSLTGSSVWVLSLVVLLCLWD